MSATKEKRNEQLAKEKMNTVDFKMVTFTLAGKVYGIDIMKVNGISKASKFTYVPNSTPFVRGVYNLRGDIISVIDLRIMFHLPAEKKEGTNQENMIILQLDEYLIGCIVDSIDKVVGISSDFIQPPHPLFGDINIKFIKGVVEHDEQLYIILDAEKILGTREEEEPQRVLPSMVPAPEEAEVAAPVTSTTNPEDLTLNFISETLSTYKKFYVSSVTSTWLERRFQEWKQERGSEDLQLKDDEEATLFMRPFYSPYTGRFWGEEYRSAIFNALPEKAEGLFSVWNPGCAKGYETYCLASILKDKYSQNGVKIWANDNDLLSISTAPNIVFHRNEIADVFEPYIVEGKNGFSFSQEVKDIILFEYHDIMNPNPFPPVNLIFARDILAFQKKDDQIKMLREFWEKLKPGGLLILGENEDVGEMAEWERIPNEALAVYRKVDL